MYQLDYYSFNFSIHSTYFNSRCCAFLTLDGGDCVFELIHRITDYLTLINVIEMNSRCCGRVWWCADRSRSPSR